MTFLMDMVKSKSLCSTVEVPVALKKAIVMQISKKPNLDADNFANYRPVFTCNLF